MRARVQVQLEKLTASFQCVTEDLRRRFMVDGEPLLHENSIGSSPVLASSVRRVAGFDVPDRPPPPLMSTSGAGFQTLLQACSHRLLVQLLPMLRVTGIAQPLVGFWCCQAVAALLGVGADT